MTRHMLIAVILTLTQVGCSKSRESNDDNKSPDPPAMNKPAPSCTTLQQCQKFDGRRVEAIGVYSAVEFSSKRKGRPPFGLPVIRLDDDVVFLGAFWSEERSDEEKHKLMGKRVRVRGTFHAKPPPDPEADPGEVTALRTGPTIQPVEQVVEEK